MRHWLHVSKLSCSRIIGRCLRLAEERIVLQVAAHDEDAAIREPIIPLQNMSHVRGWVVMEPAVGSQTAAA